MYISPTEVQIRREISEKGCITFARFMEIALYYPDGGYYINQSHIPYLKDFYTSPVTHPAFGALITIQIFNFWKILGSPKNFTILEFGSARGELAKVIMETSKELPDNFYKSIEYIEFDKLSGQAFAQHQNYPNQITGCIISNEFLDSFPVHRFEITDEGPKEVCITTLGDGSFNETLMDISQNEFFSYIDSLGKILETGSKGEANLQVNSWGKKISDILFKGFMLTIDYGYEINELVEKRLLYGTLQTHRNHCNGLPPLSKIGETDITADVNFSYVQNITEKHGLNTIKLIHQKQFLQSLGFHKLLHRLRISETPRRQLMQNQMSMLELINPQGFGQFKVLIQEKNTGVNHTNLDLVKSNFSSNLINIPLMNESNIDLLKSKYPHSDSQPTTYEGFDL